MTTKLAKWASEHDKIIKSRLSYGHQANPFHQKRGWPTIGSDLMVIWEMSDQRYTKSKFAFKISTTNMQLKKAGDNGDITRLD